MNLRTTLFAASLLAVSLGAQAQTDSASCGAVTLADPGWSDIAVTNGIASLLLDGLGYKAQTRTLAVPIIFAGLQKGQVDVFLGNWMPAGQHDYDRYVTSGQIDKVVENLGGTEYTLAVPTYAAEAGLKSFQDIAKFKDQLGGKIYAIEPGNDGNLLIDGMIKNNQFDLGSFRMVESSEAGMLVQVSRAIKKKEPVVFLGWAPHPMNTQYDITYLSGGDDVFGPDYGAAKVYTVVPPDYEARCENVGKLLGNLQFTVEMESQLMEKVLEKENPQTVAKEWIKANPAILDQWLSGVTTFDGQDGVAAVKKHVGL